MFGGKIGLPELLLILAVALLIFGPSKIADLGKGLGEGIKNFKSSVKEGEHDPDKAEAEQQVATVQLVVQEVKEQKQVVHWR